MRLVHEELQVLQEIDEHEHGSQSLELEVVQMTWITAFSLFLERGGGDWEER